MNIKFILFVFILAISSITLAQVKVESNVPVAIGSGLTVSVDNKLSVNSSVLNEGNLLFRDTIELSTYSGSGQITAEGTNQHVYLNGAFIGSFQATGGEKVLHESFTVGDLTLNGSLINTDTNMLAVTGSIIGHDATSYIMGYLIRSGSDSLYFPVGDASNYTPVILSSISGTSPSIGIKLESTGVPGSAGYGLLGVSDQRYWQVTEESGSIGTALLQLPTIHESVSPSIEQSTVAYAGSPASVFRGLAPSAVGGSLVDGTVSAIISNPGYYAVGYYFNEQLRQQDSLALVSIFENAGGESWTGASGWMNTKLDLWEKVVITNKRVTNLNLSNNNLTGEIPSFSLGLESLEQLNLSNNQIEQIGDLSSLVSLQTVDISNNRLPFGSIENVLSVSEIATYAPQKEVLQRVRSIQEIGNVYTVDRSITGRNNSYSWTKNGTSISESKGSFGVNVTDFNDDGIYVATVTNSNVPDLTITTRPVVLRVSSIQRDSASLLAIYNALNGPNSGLSDWPNLPIDEWPEVELTNSRVTELNAPNLNLSGALPEDIVDIQGLTRVDLSDNQIDGLPDFNGYLPALNSLDLSGNRLTFEDLEVNATITGLDYSAQQRFGSAISDTLNAGSMVDISQQVGGSTNNYQWFYSNDKVTDQLLTGQVSNTLIIDSLNFDNMGRYELRVINSQVPNLILRSEYQSLWASAGLNLTAFGLGDEPFLAGEGYALKITSPGEPFDTVQAVRVSDNGFLFNDLVLGDYIVAVAPDNLFEFLPTYYNGTDLWTQADTLLLRDYLSDTLNMAQIPPPGNGLAAVSGTIESDFLNEAGGRIDARRKVKRAGCSVRRFVPKGRTAQEEGDFVLYAYVQSNDEGEFEFKDLEDGLYRFNIEYPGIPMDDDSYIEFTIGEGGIEDETLILQATVTEDGIVVEKIERLGFYRNYFKDLSVYPNPASNYVTIGYSKLMSESVVVRLMDLEGNVVKEQLIEKGYNKALELDVSEMTGGIYILNFVDQSLGAEQITSVKVMVNH